jgi:hypothetical protein
LFVAEGVGLEGVQLDALGLDVPEARFDVVMTFQPNEFGVTLQFGFSRGAGPRIPKLLLPPLGPFGRVHEQAAIFIKSPNPLPASADQARLDADFADRHPHRSASVAAAHIQDQTRGERRVSNHHRSSGLASRLLWNRRSNRSQDRIPLFGVAEENIVVVVEA